MHQVVAVASQAQRVMSRNLLPVKRRIEVVLAQSSGMTNRREGSPIIRRSSWLKSWDATHRQQVSFETLVPKYGYGLKDWTAMLSQRG